MVVDVLKMFWSWPRRKIMATMTAMAMTAMARAYSTSPWQPERAGVHAP